MSFRRVSLKRLSAIPAFVSLVCVVLATAGCGGKAKSGKAYQAPITYRPMDGRVGKVVSINERLRFVVLDYSLNTMPPAGTKLVLYRSTNAIGALKLTTWRSADTAAADILEGMPEPGDEGRVE